MTDRKDAEWFQPEAPPLTKDEAAAAYKGQISYPKVVRKRRDPPISGQLYSNISVLPLPEPVNGVSAFVKVRGIWSDKQTANDDAKRIIRDVDSKFKIKITPVGTWVPVSTEYDEENVDVKMDEDDDTEEHLNDEAVKKAEARHDRIRKEIQERTKKMLDPNDDPYSDMEGLEYYVMKRVTLMSIDKWLKEMEEKKVDLGGKRVAVQNVVDELNEKYPKYSVEWIDKYNEKRKETGLPPWKEGDEF